MNIGNLIAGTAISFNKKEKMRVKERNRYNT
uniref:Uncharacterized protein MANES_01G107700 n=1 Tax=Rhizophora mucronata TaxID=61149 RepID=A0A2P2JXW3_RHIMU